VVVLPAKHRHLLGAQLKVVLTERLHPRALIDAPATEADRRAYDAYAKEHTYHPDEQVHTDFPQDNPQPSAVVHPGCLVTTPTAA